MTIILTKEEELCLAIQVATTAHGKTLSMDGTPYILHPLRLMMKAETYDQKIVAILHDVVEDTDVGIDLLISMGICEQNIEAIKAVTKLEFEKNNYNAFIQRLASNPLARYVKLLDLYDNIDLTRLETLKERDLKRANKYHVAIKYLESLS